MAKIEVKYDPTIEQSDIIARLDLSSPEESGDEYTKNPVELQQTSIYGIQCPIIAVNDIMVAYEDILEFVLMDNNHIPSVSLHIMDRKSLIRILDTPENDNELRIQILPPFEDTYKKINLTFLITNFQMGGLGNDLYINAEYKIPVFISKHFKSFGEKTTYELFDKIASDSHLGFASNVENGNDKRFIYCNYKSYKQLIDSEISKGGNESTIYDWWIDVWNYLNLANMYERYKSIDADEDMMVWISGAVDEVTEGAKLIPMEVPAELTNLFGSEESQLFVKSYRIHNSPESNIKYGTDKVYSVYSMKNKDYQDTYISDGDVKKDIFNDFEYKGEVYGDYDYITNGLFRNPFLQKIKNNLLEVDLSQPLLGIQRGNHVTFACYYNDDSIDYPTAGLKEIGVVDSDPQTETPVMDPDDPGSDSFKLDKSVSGQYMVLGNIYRFAASEGWTQTITLTRPIDQKPKLFEEE